MDFPSHSRNKLALAIMAASAAPLAQANITEQLQNADSEFTAAEIAGINSTAASHPSMAQDADGDFILVWQRHTADGDPDQLIMAQRFEANGDPLDEDPLQVSGDNNHHVEPVVGMDDDGNAVVAWIEKDGAHHTDDEGAPRMRTLAASEDGFSASTKDVVDGAKLDDGYGNLAMDMDGDGDYVIAWQDNNGTDNPEVHARTFGADSLPLTSSSFSLGEGTDPERTPDVATDDDGQFFAVWESESHWSFIYGNCFSMTSGDTFFDEARRMDNNDLDNPSQDQFNPAVAIDDEDGAHFIVGWDYDIPKPKSRGIRTQLYSRSDKTAVAGASFKYDEEETDNDFSVDVTTNSDGTYLVAWREYTGYGESDPIKLQALDSSGDTLLASPFALSANPLISLHNFDNLTIDANTNGDFTASWMDQGESPSYNPLIRARTTATNNNSIPSDIGGSESGDGVFGGTGPLGVIGGALLLAWRRLVR